jgi:hypothetical protein
MDTQFGKIFIMIGVMFTVVGIVIACNIRIPFLGKLPGDLFYQNSQSSVFIPITSCIILSVILTLLLNLIKLFK